MYIPLGFPAPAQAQVEAARLKAIRELEDARKVAPPESWNESWWDRCAFYAYIIQVFQAFGREACELGRQGIWPVARVRSEVDEFLRRLTIEEYYERGQDRYGRKLKEMTSHIGSLLPQVKEEIRQSDEWHQFEADLLAVAERQAEKNPKPGAPAESIIGRLPKGALVRMEAATATFMADYLPKLEQEANKTGPIHDAELLREFVVHQFNVVARECMAVCVSVEEFEANLLSDIARFVHYGLSQYRWLADPMREELDTAFTFFVMRANPWAEIPGADRATAWHVGAITGEALCHAALKLRAEAWARAAEGGFGASRDAASNVVDHDGAASIQPVTVKSGNGKDLVPQFPNRAAWLKDRLRERSWNKNDLSRHGGPDRKTVQKILNGQQIREEGLEKVATALSKAHASKKLPQVALLDIPQD